MPWPIPSAKTIAARIAASLETAILRIRPDIDPRAVSRAVRSDHGVHAQIGSAVSAEIRTVHDHQAWWGRQYMPDSADDEAMILRHANIWGTGQRQAIAAIGTVLIEGTAGEPLPAGIELAASNAVLYTTTASATIGIGGSVSVAAIANVAGSAGNLASGVQLATVVAYPAISKVTVDSAFEGGADAQTPDEIKAAYLQRIRQPAHGGAGFDYPVWVAEVASVKAVAVIADWIGRGSVGVVVIMKSSDGSARVPTVEEIAAIQDHLGQPGSQSGVRPVTARSIVVAGELSSIPLTLRLRPDTAATRTAVTDAYARFIATIGDEEDAVNASPIGATIEPSRVSEAISAASGEYAHDLISPAAPFTLDPTQYPVAGAITFEGV
ncbi:baseplate J/gp47 family protein [Hoeflea alexandrii]|uniref:baseplate J/gp47 family protein n=1 Tax=Hoeflea alexandrii TaxID=288436 RepID=UPI0035D00D5E